MSRISATYEDVRRLLAEDRIAVDVVHGVVCRRREPKAPLRPCKIELVGNNGVLPYARVSFGGGLRALVHRVVWWAAKGPIPEELEIDHLNANRLDNRIENLELVTSAENARRAAERGALSGPKNWSIDADTVRLIRKRAEAEQQATIARDLGLSTNVVSRILCGRTYRSVV